jgi:hypothetical protein
LRSNAFAIIHSFYGPGQSDEEKIIRNLETAGKLLKADINSMNTARDYYPSLNDVFFSRE